MFSEYEFQSSFWLKIKFQIAFDSLPINALYVLLLNILKFLESHWNMRRTLMCSRSTNITFMEQKAKRWHYLSSTNQVMFPVYSIFMKDEGFLLRQNSAKNIRNRLLCIVDTIKTSVFMYHVKHNLLSS